jgi:stalled ribosome alternative rescue factor ArfA
MKRFLVAAAALLFVSATVADARPQSPVRPASSWRNVATSGDRKRIHDWRDAWTRALAEVRTDHSAEIGREGALLDPDSGLAGAAPPPGDYRCRTIKLGSQGASTLAYVAYPFFRCRIERAGDGTLSFTRLNGSQRQVGRIFPQNSRRMIFLGTLQLGDEQGALRYGHDENRDLAALVERIGPRRWRLAFPKPHFESVLDVMELVPAG